MPKRESKLIVTHAANFHVDDVFATAASVLLFEKSGLKNNQIKIKRSLDPLVWKQADILLDIGAIYNPAKNRFDHHQGIGAKKMLMQMEFLTPLLVCFGKNMEKSCAVH